MAILKGLVSIVSELRAERTNLLNQLKHVDAALSVLGKLDGGSSYTQPRRNLWRPSVSAPTLKHTINLPHNPLRPLNRSGDRGIGSRATLWRAEQILCRLQVTHAHQSVGVGSGPV
jgi:hypothetical protein